MNIRASKICKLAAGLLRVSTFGLTLLASWFLPLAAAVAALAPSGIGNDRALLQPKPGIESASLLALHQELGVRTIKTYPDIGGLQVLQLPAGLDGASLMAIIAAYELSGLVAYVERDSFVHLLATPNDFRFQDGSLWSLENTGIYGGVPDGDIDAPEGWEIQRTADNVTVAVIDTGVRLSHEDLAPNMWVNPGESGPDFLGLDKRTNGLDDDGNGYIDDVHGINAILGTGLPMDDHGHGTHVGGIIGGVGNNSVGIVGVCWRVPIMALKCFDAAATASISDAIECIDYARRQGAKIINASWGSYTFASAALRDAILSARNADILFVAAAGNDNIDNDVNPLFPASYDLDNIVAVAATDRTDTKAFFSNFGAATVDLGAPGSPIFSCWNGSDSDYRYVDGTSMAAPHVSGVCALLWANQPGLTYSQIIARVLSTTDPLPSLAGKCVSGGRLNLHKALAFATPVTADFIANPSSGSAPLTVAFTDTSTGPVTSWSWSFGDGAPDSTAQHPTHVFTLPGNFIVTLAVTGSGGSSSSKSQVIVVNSAAPGVLSVSPDSGLIASGRQGGPFSPNSQTYSLSNTGEQVLNWSASVDKNWVSLSAASGTLAASGNTSVTVFLNSRAQKLKPGAYSATVLFSNTTNGQGNTSRTVTLTVNRR